MRQIRLLLKCSPTLPIMQLCGIFLSDLSVTEPKANPAVTSSGSFSQAFKKAPSQTEDAVQLFSPAQQYRPRLAN